MPPRQLTDAQIAAILDEFRQEASRKGIEPYELFTTRSVAERIEERYGVRYNVGNVWRRMVSNGWKFSRGPLTYEERRAAYEKTMRQKKA